MTERIVCKNRVAIHAAAAEVIKRYDESVRANQTPEWDTVAAVATCDEGIYGALGEVFDTAEEMGLSLHDNDVYDAIEDAFKGYQRRLRTEIGMTTYTLADFHVGDVIEAIHPHAPDETHRATVVTVGRSGLIVHWHGVTRGGTAGQSLVRVFDVTSSAGDLVGRALLNWSRDPRQF